MRMLLALMAVLAMLLSPALAGTKIGCQMGARQAVDFGGMSASMKSMPHPCCDPASKQKSMHKGCAQICAAPAAVAITVAPMTVDAPSLVATLVMTRPNAPALRAFEPLGLKRPPKHIA